MDDSINTKLLNGTLIKAKRYLSSNYDMLLVGFIIPIVGVLMWYLGRISPEYHTPLTFRAFLINTLYAGLITSVIKITVTTLWQKLEILITAKKIMVILATALVMYLVLHTMILSLVEQKSGVTLLIALYAIGGSLVTAMVFLFISKEISSPTGKSSNFLRVSLRGKTVIISTDQAKIIETKHQITNIIDHSGTTYLSSQSLLQIEKSLNSYLYFRINRQQIIYLHGIIKWERQPNKTVKVWMTGRVEPVVVSRSRGTQWKAWVSAKTNVQK